MGPHIAPSMDLVARKELYSSYQITFLHKVLLPTFLTCLIARLL